MSSFHQAATPDSPWVQVLDTQDMDQHALAQQGWALQYEQLSPGQFKGHIHQVELPEVTLLREDTSINTGGGGSGGAGMADAGALQASEAFRNPRHPEHQATVAKWNQIVTKGVADAPVM